VRIVGLLVVACLIFGVGSVLGAGADLFHKSKDVGGQLQAVGSSSCEKPDNVVDIGFSKTKYPHIRKHVLRSIREGWPSVYVLNRKGASERRDRLLEGVPTKPGFDRDEEPPAVGRKTWRAHVALVPSSENRSHGSSLGIKLRRFCDGTRFKFVWY
jgi:hypothetical protein